MLYLAMSGESEMVVSMFMLDSSSWKWPASDEKGRIFGTKQPVYRLFLANFIFGRLDFWPIEFLAHRISG